MPRQRLLKPILDLDAYHKPIQEEIEYYFYDLLYRPLLEILKDDTGLKSIKINSGCMGIPFSDLLQCPYNRELDAQKYESIYRDLQATGTMKPFVVTEVSTDAGKKWMITDGHHRYKAIEAMIFGFYLKDDVKIPCVVSGEKGVNSAQYEMRRKINSKSSAIEALKDGRIQYIDGVFVGEMNAGISRYFRGLGGKFNKIKKGWKVDLDQMPPALKVAVMDSRNKSREIVAKLQKKIDQIERDGNSITRPVNPKPQIGKVLESLQGQFEKTTGETLSIKPEMNPGMENKIEVDYSKNLNKYIKGWEEEAIFRLREQVEANAFTGFRADKMVDRIMAEAFVSKRKAEFLARQETSLLVSKYRQVKYEDAGIDKYQWSTSHDSRVRHRHEELDGRIFSFDNPPITDQATGARNNPGEDFNCRCVAIPIFDEPWEREIK